MKKIVFLILIGFLISGCDKNLPHESEDPPSSTEKPFIKINEDDDRIYYQGSATVSGIYREWNMMNMLGEVPCFEVDESDRNKLPYYFEGQNNEFCFFEEQAMAKELLGINDGGIFKDESVECIEGKATVQISDYTLEKNEGEAISTAHLSKVISQEPYSVCQ